MIRATFAARGICSSSRAFAASSSVRQCLRTTAEMALATCASRTISRNSMRCICWDILHQFLIYGCYLFGRVSAGFTPSVSEPVSQRPLRSSDFSIQQSHPLSSCPRWRIIRGGLRDSWTIRLCSKQASARNDKWRQYAKRAFPLRVKQIRRSRKGANVG